MTATELRDFALKNNSDITGVHAMKKKDLLLAIHQARGENAPTRFHSTPKGEKGYDRKRSQRENALLRRMI